MRHPTHVQFSENDPIPAHRGKKFQIVKAEIFRLGTIGKDEHVYRYKCRLGNNSVFIFSSSINSPDNNWTFFFEPITISQFQELLTNIRSTLNVLCNESNDVQQNSGGVS